MAAYVLLEAGDKADRVRVVVHTAVPNSNNLTNAERITNLETEIAARETVEFTRLQGILDYYGKTGTV